MSENSLTPRHILHLVVEGFSDAGFSEITKPASNASESVEVFSLTETNGRKALEKIFAADTIAVWGSI
jgi:hypothetical protein